MVVQEKILRLNFVDLTPCSSKTLSKVTGMLEVIILLNAVSIRKGCLDKGQQGCFKNSPQTFYIHDSYIGGTMKIFTQSSVR